MSITFVNSANGGTTSTTTFSITLPTTQANDIIILEYVHRATADATIGGTYSGPAFTEKHDQQFATSTFKGATLWSRATGNHSGQTVTGSGLTNACAAIITVYRGCITTSDPLADATIVGEQNASANETQAQITTATAGAWVVLVVANSPDFAVTAQTCTSPGSLTARAEVLSTGGTDASISHASAEKASAGATGAFTWSQTDSASGSWAYALKPEPGATWLAALNTSVTIDTSAGNVQRRLRIGVVNSGSGAGASAFKWQYSKNSGTWTDITASSSNVKTFASAYYADGDDVPQIITSSTYQSDNNAGEESTGAFTLTASIAAGSRFETEIALEFIAADVADTDTLDFRIVQSTGTVLDSYTVTPRATIEEAAVIDVVVAISTETDATQVLTRLKTKSFTQTAEIDATQALTRLKARAIVQATETDAPQVLTIHKAKALVQTTETDQAPQIKINPIHRLIIQALETDNSIALSSARLKTIAQTTEIDTVQILTKQKAWGLALTTETDTPQVLTKRKNKSISLISEASLSQVLTSSRAKSIALSLETDISIALNRAKLKALAQTTELNTAQILTHLKRLAISIATETNAAQVILVSAEHIITVTQVTETDITFAIRVNPIHRLVNQVNESDSSQVLNRLKTKSVPLNILEMDIAQTISHLKQMGISQATETNLANALTTRKLRGIGLVTEIDVAFAAEFITPPQFIILEPILEIDTIIGDIRSAKNKDIELALETSLARNIIPLKGSEGTGVIRRRHGVFYYGHRGRMGI